MAYVLNLDEASIEAMLHDPEGDVGKLLGEIAHGMTAVARARVPYMEPKNYAWSMRRRPPPLGKGVGPTQYMPRVAGWTAATIWYHPPANDSMGRLFAGTNVWYAPTLWLERGRKGRHMELHQFMSQALDSASA